MPNLGAYEYINLTPKLSFERRFRMFSINGCYTKIKRVILGLLVFIKIPKKFESYAYVI